MMSTSLARLRPRLFLFLASVRRRGEQAGWRFSVSNDEKTSIRACRLLTEVPLFSNLLPRSSRLNAGVAQLVEQRIRNAKVVGSTPIIGTIHLYLIDLINIKFIQSEIA